MQDQSSCGAESCCCQCNESGDGATRRDFLTLTAGAVAAVGAGSVAWPLIESMNPAADTLAVATTEVDVSGVKEGQALTVMWQGSPVFIRHRTAKEIEEARATPLDELKHPEKDEDRVKQSSYAGKAMPQWLVVLGKCTHLGCIPRGQKPTDPHGEYDGWFCPCHGSQYDTSGRIRKGPAPTNLQVPPYQFVEVGKIKIG